MTKLIFALSTILVAASAFTVPGSFSGTVLNTKCIRSSLLTMKSSQFEDEAGVTAPLGFWDPAGLTDSGDEEIFRRRRMVELKHGRVAMAATTGNIVQDLFRFPGYLSTSENLKFADIPSGLAALKAIPPLGILQIILFIGVLELFVFKQDPEKEPGDVGGKLWLRYKNPEVRKSKLNKELNNGRAAMMGIMGMLVGEAVTGQTPLEQIISGHLIPFGDGQGYF